MGGHEMTLLRPVPVEARQLHWDAPTRRFLAEISDIGGTFGQVWDDSCDEGLTLVSRYPHRPEIVFTVNRTEVSADREVLYWDLEPASPAARPGFTVRVFND
jgi:hypothetical protein